MVATVYGTTGTVLIFYFYKLNSLANKQKPEIHMKNFCDYLHLTYETFETQRT